MRPGDESVLSEAIRACRKCRAEGKPEGSISALAREIEAMADARGFKLRFLIALVPDPIGSYVGSQFDTYTTALLRGASSAGWIPDRHWLPWRDTDAAASDKEPAPQSVVRPWNSPGIVLFRKSPDLQRRSPERILLTVFLVGESPLGGIRKQAFVDALRLISALQPGEKIQVLGPFSSGSAESCALALGDWYGTRPSAPTNPVAFLSGSATSLEIGERLKPRCASCESLKVDFRRTVSSDAAMQEAAFRYFEDVLGWRTEEIAVVVESDSSYGSNVAAGGKRYWRLLLEVPSALSSVRTASERSRKIEEVEIAGVRVPPAGLELKLEEVRTARDTFPVFDPMTAPLNELELDSLLSILAKEKIRHLGLVFTDIRDRLFMAEKVKEAAPHLSLFTFESSLLYVHPRVNPYTDGMIVISSYPLSMDVQRLMGRSSDRRGRRVQFGSDPEQGVYNAMAIALADRMPSVADYMTIPGTTFSAPAVWISAVGDGELVPLAVVRPFAKTDLPALLGTAGSDSAPRASASGVPPELRRLIRRLSVAGGLRLCFWIASVVLVLLGASLDLAYSKTEAKTRLPLAGGFRPLVRPDQPARRQQKRWIVVLVATVAFSWLALATVYVVPFVLRVRSAGERRETAFVLQHGDWMTWLEEALMRGLVPFLPVIAVLLVVLFARLGWMLKDGEGRRRPTYATVLGGAMALALVVSWRALSPFRPEPSSLDRAVFTFLRASGGAGRVSPLAGILLLAWGFVLIVAFQLHRLRIRDDWRCRMPVEALADSDDLPLRSLEKPQERLDERILQALPRSVTFWGPFLVLLGPLLVVFFFRFEASADSSLWARTFAFLFAFVLLPSSLAAFYRFASLWRALRRIIVRQEWSRLAPAFQSCQEELEWRSLKVWGPSRKHNYSTLIGSAELLRRLCYRPGRPRVTEEVSVALQKQPVALKQLAHDVDRHLTEALEANARGELEAERVARIRALAALDEASQHVQRMLNHVDSPGAFSTESEIRKELTEYVALRAIAYIRYVFAEIRNSLLAFTGGILFLLAGLASFHFQPIRSVYVVLWSVIGVVAIVTVAIFIQMDRDTVLSRISGTTPGEVNPIKSGLLLRIAAFVVPPVATLLVTQFPRLGQPLASWLNPLIRVFQ
jgi:cell division protein ZapA (FtsZ GTPase activity inhibitor)